MVLTNGALSPVTLLSLPESQQAKRSTALSYFSADSRNSPTTAAFHKGALLPSTVKRPFVQTIFSEMSKVDCDVGVIGNRCISKGAQCCITATDKY